MRSVAQDAARGPAGSGLADQMNSMPKYVASRSLRAPLGWNATLLEGDLAESVTAKDRHDRTLVAVGAGKLADALITMGLVGEWFW
jgi:hypothetical protein